MPEIEIPPKIPPRTHPVHLRNRLKVLALKEVTNLSPDITNSDDSLCPSRRASSVGFVDVNDLLKYQDDCKSRCHSRLYTSLRHLFTSHQKKSEESPDLHEKPVESHINPMFANHQKTSTISQSLTHLPLPPRKRKSPLRRVFSCFSHFK